MCISSDAANLDDLTRAKYLMVDSPRPKPERKGHACIKVVTHRSRTDAQTKKSAWARAVLHIAAMLSAVIAILAALIATFNQSTSDTLTISATSGLAAAGAILLLEIVVVEVSNPADFQSVSAVSTGIRPKVRRCKP